MFPFDIQLQCDISWWKRFYVERSGKLPSFPPAVPHHVPLTKERRADFISVGD